MYKDFFNQLKEEFKRELPGELAHKKMAPNVRKLFNTSAKRRNAGVLILLYPKNNQLYTVCIKRTEYEGAHSGQISFPGGKFEPEDHTLEHTALRESKEEIGIYPKKVNILGQLTPLHIPVSNFYVLPFVGFYATIPKFKRDPIEVEKIIEIPLSDLLNPKNCTLQECHYGELAFTTPIYKPKEIVIWGATAMIMSEFLEVVKKINLL
ncbi:MAG: CoA pyrophosphatase [Bacteroidota bacterium]|nr:CoA pyrophosphatase [Bacteroidota bacterium]